MTATEGQRLIGRILRNRYCAHLATGVRPDGLLLEGTLFSSSWLDV